MCAGCIVQPLLDSFDLHGVAELIKAGKARKIVVMAGGAEQLTWYK